MRISIGTGIGPVRVSQRIGGGKRRRRSTGSSTSLLTAIAERQQRLTPEQRARNRRVNRVLIPIAVALWVFVAVLLLAVVLAAAL